MVSGINDGKNQVKKTAFSQLPSHVNKLVGRTFSLSTLPNESKTMYLARKVFEVLGTVLIIGVLIPALPILFTGFALEVASQPSKEYKIGRPKKVLNNDDALRNLKALAKSKREFDNIEIVQTSGQTPFHLTDEMLAQMKAIQPQHIILSNVVASHETLDKLETPKHYYIQKSSRTEGNVTNHTLELKEKISLVVLPSDQDELIKTLKDITDKKHRIINVYFTQTVPYHLEQPVKNYMNLIRPATQCLLLSPRDQRLDVCASILKA